MKTKGEHPYVVDACEAVAHDVYAIVCADNGKTGFLHRHDIVLESIEDEVKLAELDAALSRRQ